MLQNYQLKIVLEYECINGNGSHESDTGTENGLKMKEEKTDVTFVCQ